MKISVSHACSPDGPGAGFILVAALWILVALATLASVASVYVAHSAVALRTNDDALKTEALIAAGLELAAYQLSAPVAEKRPTRGAFRFRLSRADIAVEYLSEAARIDLNGAPKALIAGLFTVLGAQAEAAEQYADRVIGWRSPPRQNGPDSEDALYRAAGLLYSPRRSPFNHVDELWLVLGLPPGLVERAVQFVTVYSARNDVNVLDAPAEVIAALPGVSSGRLNAFLSQRENLPPDPKFIAGALGDNQAGATIKGSDAYRVRLQITFEDGRRTMSEVIIMMMTDSKSELYRVMSWRNDIEPQTGRSRAGGR
jgi:general secretion pathway protein K